MIKQNQAQKKPFLKMHKASYLMIAAAIIVVAFIFLSPVFSQSTSPCSECHSNSGYSQYLDILEDNVGNQLPTTLDVGQTATVSVVVENNVNTVLYAQLSDVALTLSSQNGHFSVSVPTFSVRVLDKGTTTASWQITGVSAGSDALVISASARNSHKLLSFQDTYSPAPNIVISTPTPTSTPPSTTTPTPIQTQPPTTTSNPTLSPNTTSTPNTTNELPTNPQEQNNQNDLKIWFTIPTEGETWTAGNKTIGWTTTGGSGNSNIKLELSKSRSSGPWITLAENLTTNNNYIWNVPSQNVDYVIRATVADSANPPQTASVTVAATINSTIQIDVMMRILSYAMILFFVILVAIVLKKQVTKEFYWTQYRENKNMRS